AHKPTAGDRLQRRCDLQLNIPMTTAPDATTAKVQTKPPAGQALDGDEGTTFNYLSSIPTGHKTHSVSLVYLHNPVGQATDCHRRYGVYHLCRITN
ncbi:hypothetical protein, partial [Shewanella sp. ECSMB14101]|uniref:hypothetical protein n=1 Tax=Shewanella sp. ECSMB14101 TaxID=1565129 RepID=UPI001F43B646